jgi:predicted dehydrogenase
MSRVRMAVVGLGWVGTHRHLPWLRRCPAVEVVGVVDHRVERVAAASVHMPALQTAVAEEPGEVPWLAGVDAVSIATPPASHHRLALGYLEAGKDVLLEKPMAMEVAQAEELRRAAELGGRILGVVHNFQFARSVARLTRLLAAGRLGELKGIWAAQLSNPRRRLPPWYESLPLGLFYDESPHFMYLLRALLPGEPSLRSAQIVRSTEGRSTPARVSALFESGGVPAQVDMNFEAPVSEWQVAVIGSDRMAVVDIFRDILVVVRNDGTHAARDILRTSFDSVRGHLWGTFTSGVLLARGRLAYGNDEVMRRFADACLNRTEPAAISGRDGLRVVEMQHAILDLDRAV